MYIKVILPLRLHWEPCYRASGTDVRPGVRVSVNFAGRRYVGVVSQTDAVPDVEEKKIRDIIGVESHLPVIGARELELWHFISDYYLCSIGEVYRLAYPSQKTAGEEAVAHSEMRREKREMMEREKLEKKLGTLSERLARKEKELEGKHNENVSARLASEREKILSEIAGIKAALLGREEKTDSGKEPQQTRLPHCPAQLCKDSLNIRDAFKTSATVLLHGNDLRIRAVRETIADHLSRGNDVLLTVPDISLSRDLQKSFEEHFGGFLHVYHSGESASRRRDIASALRDNSSSRAPMLVLGTRSALFLPFTRLGLIVVEDEHDAAYKNDSSPRFNGRDTAVMMGSIHGAKVLLSSATPSLESVYNCDCGRYRLVESEVNNGTAEVIDTNVERRKNGMIGDLSRILIQRMDETLSSGGKVLVIRPWGPMDDMLEALRARWPEAVESGQLRAETSRDARRMDISGTGLLALTGTDILLDRNDFRADERALQVMDQFRGRFKGEMLIQTRQGGHQLFNTQGELRRALMEERKAVGYPPYSRMVDIVLRDTNIPRLEKLSGDLMQLMSAFNAMGPFTPSRGRTPVEDCRIIRTVLGKGSGTREEKKKIAGIVGDFEESRKYPGHISIDVDPL